MPSQKNREAKLATTTTPGTLRQKIAEQLSAEFAALPPGSPIPSGIALRKRFGVAYMTIINALNDLTVRDEIVRIHGKGSYTAGRGPKIVYLLTRSPGDTPSAAGARLLEGALRQAAELEIRLFAHPVSLSGRNDDIDWNNMERLPERAPVIVWGLWYHRVFDFLIRRHCRVVYIDPYDITDGLSENKTSEFHRLVVDRSGAVHAAVARFRAIGKKRIVLYHHENHEDGVTRAAFRRAMAAENLEFSGKLELYSPNNFNDAWQNFRSFATWHYPFDAVLAQKPPQALAVCEVLRALKRDIREDTAVASLEDDRMLAARQVGVSVYDSDFENLGREAVRLLAANPAERVEKVVPFKFIDRHSL